MAIETPTAAFSLLANNGGTNYTFSFTTTEADDAVVYLFNTSTGKYELKTASSDYTLSGSTVTFNSAPADRVLIFRRSDFNALKIPNFTPGSSIRGQDLDSNFTQLLQVSQEFRDLKVDRFFPELDSGLDMNSNRILELGPAQLDTDAVNRLQLGNVIASDITSNTTQGIALTKTQSGSNSGDEMVISASDSSPTQKGTVIIAPASNGAIDVSYSSGTASIGIPDGGLDVAKIKAEDVITTAEQIAQSPSWVSDDDSIATIGALAERHDVVVSTSLPTTTQAGKQWLNTTPGNQEYKIYDGSGWRTVAVGQPYSPAVTTVVRYVDTVNGSDAVDVTGFLPQAPLQSIGRALELVNTSSGGDGTLIKIASGVYKETLPLRIKKNNISIIGESMRSCFVHPTVATETNDMFEVDSGSYISNLTLLGLKVPTTDQGSRNNSLDNDSTYGLPTNQPFSIRFRTDIQPVILKSPYIQNCTHFSDAHFDNANFDPNTFPSTDAQTYSAVAGDQSSAPCGGGLLVDGSAVSSSSPIRSMVVDAFTQIVLDGPGILVTNNGYAQLVSFFGTFAHYHAKAKNGGQINLSNCVSDFGRYGLIADGKSPSAIATATASAANSGATTITIGAISTAGSFHGTVSRPLNHMMVTIDGVDYGVVSSTANGSGWDVVLTSGLTSNITNTTVSFALRSYISTGGHTFEFVGVGTDYSAHPDFGGVPVEANQVIELNGGKVWQSSTDHVGKFKAGNVLVVDQVSETVDLGGVVTFKGDTTTGSGQFKLNCENNSHGITIKGPPHSAAASYTLTLPNNDGNSSQVLQTDGSGTLSWVDQSSGGGGGGGGSSYANSDVDTHLNIGTATTNQVLSWDGSDYDWVAQSGGASIIDPGNFDSGGSLVSTSQTYDGGSFD